jgi:uncharacterized protein YjiS (DUF1127 family)
MAVSGRYTMNNTHGNRLLAQAMGSLRQWRQRSRQRRELAQWTERDLHDIGVSWSAVASEISKPFWRA